MQCMWLLKQVQRRTMRSGPKNGAGIEKEEHPGRLLDVPKYFPWLTWLWIKTQYHIHIRTYYNILYHIITYYTILYHIIPYYIYTILYHIIPCYAISYHIIYHIYIWYLIYHICFHVLKIPGFGPISWRDFSPFASVFAIPGFLHPLRIGGWRHDHHDPDARLGVASKQNRTRCEPGVHRWTHHGLRENWNRKPMVFTIKYRAFL